MKLPIHIFTLALDSIQFLPRQLAVFEKLERDWTWHIVSGVADNVLDTSRCAKIQPRFSRDGTDEWLTAHMRHPNIRIYRRQLWPGKVSMCNAALANISEPCSLMQIDSDEFWSAEQLEKIASLYDEGACERMRFFCQYFVGENIVVTSENAWANRPGEWSRSWLWKPGMFFKKHEPPMLQGCGALELTRERTRELGLVFRHEAYRFIESVQFKQHYYSYKGAVEGWKRLQANTGWPCRLKDFLAWVDDKAVANVIK